MPKYIDARNEITIMDINRLENLYTKKLNKGNINLSNLDFFMTYIENLSRYYFVKRSEKNIPLVIYKSSFLQISNNNFLFLKFLKFHLGYLSYLEAYEKNDLAKLEVNSIMIESFIMKSFYNCLNNYKDKNTSKIDELNDFELISNVCIKERLTAFNYLSSFDRNKKEVRDFLNMEYMNVFRGKSRLPKFDKKYTNVKFHDMFEIYSSKDINDNSIKI